MHLCMNDYNRHMVNRIRLPSFLGGPNICHHNVRLHCYKYLCMNDYSQISVITMLGCFVTCTCAWMITTGTWWTGSGYPASWEAQISVITMLGCIVTSTCAWMITAKYLSSQCWVALLQVLAHEWLQPNICHHNVGLHCYMYLCMNDYNRHMVNRIRLPSFLGGPNTCHTM